MGFMAAILGSVASTAQSASSAVASEAMNASESAVESAAASGMIAGADGMEIMKSAPEAFAGDTSDIMRAGEEAAKAETEKVGKSFFSRAWDESKNAVGIGENADMGKVGYNAAKMAISKGNSSEQQQMDYTPAQTTAPAAPAANAEDELNKLRNRMNAV